VTPVGAMGGGQEGAHKKKEKKKKYSLETARDWKQRTERAEKGRLAREIVGGKINLSKKNRKGRNRKSVNKNPPIMLAALGGVQTTSTVKYAPLGGGFGAFARKRPVAAIPSIRRNVAGRGMAR